MNTLTQLEPTEELITDIKVVLLWFTSDLFEEEKKRRHAAICT